MRPRKNRDFAAEIALAEEKIKKAEKKVKELKAKLKDILKDRDAEVHQALAATMKEKNLTLKDVVELVAVAKPGEVAELSAKPAAAAEPMKKKPGRKKGVKVKAAPKKTAKKK